MSDITDRLKELAHAAADQNWGEFSMRVPADHTRDADLVLLAASKEITSLRAELERERMRLAACGVVAMANTPESAARTRDIHPDYRSASCDDVARAVDSEMSLRAELAELRKKVAWWTDRMQETYDKSSPASKYPNIRQQPCCEHAHVVHCVCEISFLCPYHGGKCHGSHD